jgi:glycosyltransferase involved in cell wall biosynthesis
VAPQQHRLVVGVDLRCLVDPQIRGFARYTLELVSALSLRQDLTVLGFTDHQLAHPVPIEVVTFGHRREWLSEQVALPKTLREHHIAVVVCPTNRGLPFFGPPAVLVLHDAVEWDPALVVREGISRGLIRFLYASALSMAAASRVVTVSRFSAGEITRVLGINGSWLRVIHEAPGGLRPAGKPEPAPCSGPPWPRPYVLYFGGYDLKKDIPTLLRGYAQSSLSRSADLLVVGEGGERTAAVRELARKLGVSERVHLLGYVPDVRLQELLGGALCFASASLAEGFGLPAAEAMAAGIPVLVAAAGATPEIVRAGGRYFAPGDWVALAALLDGLLDPEVAALAAEHALQRAGHFSWARTAESFAQVCREAAAEPAAVWVKVFRILRFGWRWTVPVGLASLRGAVGNGRGLLGRLSR